MSRYIDADKLMDEFDRCVKECETEVFHIDLIADMVNDEPTADVRENVRGDWIVKKDIINCSVCKRCSWSKSYEDLVRSFNFCPNCGADMRGDNNEMDSMQ